MPSASASSILPGATSTLTDDIDQPCFALADHVRIVKDTTLMHVLDALPVSLVPSAESHGNVFEQIGCATLADLRRLPRKGAWRGVSDRHSAMARAGVWASAGSARGVLRAGIVRGAARIAGTRGQRRSVAFRGAPARAATGWLVERASFGGQRVFAFAGARTGRAPCAEDVDARYRVGRADARCRPHPSGCCAKS